MLLLANLSLSNFAFSSRVKNGFEALEIKDYFKAKKLFSKSLKYNPSPSGYGLATIYSRNDNPFYDIDSAYRYILISDSTWNLSKQRKKEKWAHYGWTQNGIDSLKQIVSAQFYVIAKNKKTVKEYTRFITMHPWADEYSKALYSRDSLAFHEAVAVNTSESYKNYMETYPESEFFEIAKQNYFHAQFLELTGDGSLESYKEFVAKFPNSPLRYEADSMIYLFVTEPNTEDSYREFITDYSGNKLILKGWQEFYQVYLFDYSKERMLEFLQLYPTALNKLDVEKDIMWYDSILLPFFEEESAGLMNTSGETILLPRYEYLSESFDGLFLFGKNEKLGIINRNGDLILNADFDVISYLSKGRFVVEKDEVLGLVDRNGRVLLPCELDDIGNLKNGLVYLSKNDKYFYTDYNGRRKIDSSYIDATDFMNDFAIVENEEGYGVINLSGEYVISPIHNKLKWLNDSILSYSEGSKWGMISLLNDTITIAKYDYIGEFKDGFSIASKNDTLLYLNENGKNEFNQYFSTFPNVRVKGEFVNGTAIVNRGGEYGRINLQGDIITDIEYENLALGTKFIPFEEDGFWGILSLSNKVIVESKFDRVELIKEKYAIVNYEDSLGVIGVDGKLIIPIKYKSIAHVADNAFSVFDGIKYGLYIDNMLVTGLEFSSIELFNEEFVSLTNENGVIYYDLISNRIIKHQPVLE